MNSLIFFLFNLVCVFGDYIYPQSTSTLYVNNTYNITWNFPDVNNNLTHIFLTHGNPFKLSKFNNNQMVLSEDIMPTESNYEWHLPYELNYYSISDIDWRILLSNSSTPYSGNIGSHSIDSIIYLSDFFRIDSNMNITYLEQNLLRLNTPVYFTSNGFILNSTETPILFRLNLTNSTNDINIATFSELPFENEHVLFDISNSYVNSYGNFPYTYELTLKNMEEGNFKYTPFLEIHFDQNSINRNLTSIPILFIDMKKLLLIVKILRFTQDV